MKLAIGDVVRLLDDMALGTVTGFSGDGSNRFVVVTDAGGMLRYARAGQLALVARHLQPMTRGRRIVGGFAFAIALLMTYVAVRSARELGADWALAFLSGLGGYTVIAVAYRWWIRLTGSRRVRV
ncbi:hypothetical protein ACIHFE_14040 [Streptomyces sp. NPDC052396]|uniref:hypothetical protein n=1 Tax=Streptomyces sp. NPDC052396 TaxID=3365689 RepID=UPI0037CE31CC